MSAAAIPDATSAQTSWDASVIEWLAGLFVAPMSAETITGFRDGLGARFLLTVMEEAGCADGGRQMQAALGARSSPIAAARDLAAAFAKLFDGPGGPASASPYESAHVGGASRLFQMPVSDMERMLRHCNLATIAELCEPADHLSVELALLAHLMRGGGCAPALASLLDDHLLDWVPRFAEQCRGADACGFYAGAAQMLAAFLTTRRTTLQFARMAESATGEAPWQNR